MRALSFKTGIACLCGTEVKEKFQCESLPVSPRVWCAVTWGKQGCFGFLA